MLDALRDANVLVTGGAGFIGSHLVEALCATGSRVRVIDDLSTGSRDNVPATVEFIEASVLDPPALDDALADCAVVLHQAAMVSVTESVAAPDRCHAINVEGTVRVLEAARIAGARRVVLASSCAVYGPEPRLPSREDDTVIPISPYAASKAAAEGFIAAYARCYELDAVSLRYFNVFGPRQDPRSAYAAVIAAFHHALAGGRRPIIHGDGLQTRDFIDVSSVVDANLRAAAHPSRLDGIAINVGTGVQTSLLELLQTMGRVLGVEPAFDFSPSRPGDVPHSCADVTRARELLGFEPEVDLESGLRRLIESSH